MKALYEAHRPASWTDLVGQDKLVQRLSICGCNMRKVLQRIEASEMIVD